MYLSVMAVSGKHRTPAMIACIAAIIAFVLLFNPDLKSPALKEFFNFGHVPVFGIIALFIFRMTGKEKPAMKRALIAWLLAMALGLMVELIQLGMKGRYFETGDLINDGIGALAFLAIFFRYENRGRALAARVTALLIIVLAGVPFYAAVIREIDSRREFPVISSFENVFDISSWEKDGARLARSNEHASVGLYSGMVTFLPGGYSTLCNERLLPDWTGYGVLAMDVYLPGNKGLTLTLRINDREHNQEFNDRFNSRIRLAPGPNHVEIKLKDVEKAPYGRRMDMASIDRICIFAANLAGQETVYLDNMRLEKSPR